jgi:hypothetical protein
MVGNSLPESEWHFDGLPQDEVEPCYLYEYGREWAKQLPAFSELLGKWRATAAKGGCRRNTKAGLPFSERLKPIRQLRRFFEADEVVRGSFPSVTFHEFPETPWQDIRENARRFLLESFRGMRDRWGNLPHDRLFISTLRELRPTNVDSIEAFRFLHEVWSRRAVDQTEYGFFAVDWNYPDPEIRRALEVWLREQRKYRKAAGLPGPQASQRSRGGLRDRLRWLGALRFRNHYTPAELRNHADAQLFGGRAPYCHLPDLYANAKRAEDLLPVLFAADSR